VAEGATEYDEVTYTPSRDRNADCFDCKGAIFSAVKKVITNEASKL
jgi:hypothetical protein